MYFIIYIFLNGLDCVWLTFQDGRFWGLGSFVQHRYCTPLPQTCSNLSMARCLWNIKYNICYLFIKTIQQFNQIAQVFLTKHLHFPQHNTISPDVSFKAVVVAPEVFWRVPAQGHTLLKSHSQKQDALLYSGEFKCRFLCVRKIKFKCDSCCFSTRLTKGEIN